MEAKFLASVFSFLSIFLAIYAQSSDLSDFAFETAIYYGDSNVNIGEPFSITCIIPLTDPISWRKDGEPITLHNLRHGRDEHSYMLSESNIEGEKHKIEAHIKVRHALKVHEGKYQCNDRHSSYHILYVHSPVVVPKPQTKSPFIITADDDHLSTESVYETIHDLTPSSADEIFTRVWEMEPAQSPGMPLPTQITTTPIHRRQHHHHHPQPKVDEHNKFIYINASNFDGSPSRSASEGDSKENLLNLEYLPPTRRSELSTVAWQSGTSIGNIDRNVMNARSEYPPMPDFPPPRTAVQSTTPASSMQYYTPVHHHGEHHSHSVGVNTAVTTHGYHQELQSTFPLQTMQPTYHQHARTSTKQTTFQNMLTYPTQKPLNPYQQYNQAQMYPTLQQQQQQHQHQQHVPSAPVISTATMLSPPAPVTSAPTTHLPIRKESDFLVPNYDNAEHQLKVFEIRSPLVLSCNITQPGDFELTWEKNGTIVSKVKELQGRYKILAPERKFIIDRTDVYDDGLYSCVANNVKKDINVVARVVVRVPSNTGVVEGEKLSIVCTVVGTDPQLSWAIGNLTISNSTGRYKLEPDDNKVENAILTLENVSLDDRGEFKCIGRNAANEYANYPEASDVSFVRVKGKLAALWPFLGICAEVLILCAIILIYEKRRNKNELDESDTDPQDH